LFWFLFHPTMAEMKKKAVATTSVPEYMAALNHSLKDGIEELRAVFHSMPGLEEKIKWNAPSYSVSGIDLFTFNFHDPSVIRLVFHYAPVVEISSDILEGTYKDRRLVYLKSMDEVRQQAAEIKRIATLLIEMVTGS
jgi:hypothetical protein